MTPRTQDQWAEHYSPRNALILDAAGATAVAGYREWQEAGRQVRKGEHGIHLMAPVVKKDPETGEPRVVNMKTATVFDISQTDPMPEKRTPAMALQDAVSGRIAEGEAEPITEQRAAFERETRATQALFADMEDQAPTTDREGEDMTQWLTVTIPDHNAHRIEQLRRELEQLEEVQRRQQLGTSAGGSVAGAIAERRQELERRERRGIPDDVYAVRDAEGGPAYFTRTDDGHEDPRELA